MIGTVRKHQSWLWAFIITVTIVSFLYWSPNVTRNNAGGGSASGYDFGSIGGKKISAELYRNAAAEVRILGFFSTGKWLDQSDLSRPEWNHEIYNRLVLFQKMDDLNVRPTDTATAQWIKNLITRGSGGDVPYDQYERIIKNNFEPQGVSTAQFEEFARHELGREHLQAVYGLSGAMVTPAEAAEAYHYENDQLNTKIVVFSGSNYLSQVKIDEHAIRTFYTNQAARGAYHLQPRVQVQYVQFPMTNFLAEADKELAANTNLNAILDAQYYRRTNEFKGVSRDEAVKTLKQEARHEVALNLARRQAADFIEDLYKGHDDSNPLTVQDLAKVASEKKAEVKTSPLFDRGAKTNEVHLPLAAIQGAFRLSDNDPEDKAREGLYTRSPAVGEDGAYVLGLKQRVGSTQQPYDAVKDAVVRDYKQMEANKLAQNAGAEFGNYVTNQIAKGKTFAAICEEKKVKPISLPGVSLNTRSLPELPEAIDLRQLKVVATKLTPGKATDFVSTMDGGFVTYLESRTPADAAKMQSELPKFTEQMREQRQYAAFNQWFMKQWDELHVVAPSLEQKTQGQPRS